MKNTIVIKNMVCRRCLDAVNLVFKELNIQVGELQLGKVSLMQSITTEQKEALKKQLANKGFELLDDKQTQLVSNIKSILIQEIHYQKEPSAFNFSALLAKKLNRDYTYLSRLFSSVEGQTIERYILAQKVEKIKEMLTYDELTIAEIANQMHYSSPAHLSAQFKKLTGMSPSAFKKNLRNDRKFLDSI